MPPPLRYPSLIPSPSICTRKCSRISQARSFSSTTRQDQRITRNRRALYSWLSQIGTNFRDPIPGSTNYLSAYTPDGKLRRSANDKDGNNKNDKKEGDTEAQKTTHDGAQDGLIGEDGPPGQNGAQKTKKKDLPPETARDLRPFPLNPDFRSQPVLSEAEREKIWERVMIDGKSVRDVSAELSVEMSRVGAVVRLMEIEKEWKRIVSCHAYISTSPTS